MTNQINNTSIFKQIEVGKDHIENFQLDSTKGTKKLRSKYRKCAIKERNSYVQNEIKDFKFYSRLVYYNLHERIKKILPFSNEEYILNQENNISKYEDYIINTNDFLEVSAKMGFEQLLFSMDETISLEQLNSILKQFIESFKSAGINLNSEDFSYTMFTKMYMDMYLNNYNDNSFLEVSSSLFEEIFFECPKIIMQLKLCLKSILKKYETDLDKYFNNFINNKMDNENIDKNNILDLYIKEKENLFWFIQKDSYRNLKLFLDKTKNISDYLVDSSNREKMFSTYTFSKSYNVLNDSEKFKYNENMMDFYGTIYELNEFYRYEFLLIDLKKRYKEKEKFKQAFEQKNKEFGNCEKNRKKILKNYLSATKPKLIKFLSKNNSNIYKLRMNEELDKLDIISDELEDASFNNDFIKVINDASSIYDLFQSSLLSFSYLENIFSENFKDNENYNFIDEFKRFIKFLFNYHNDFLRKINGLNDYDIAAIIVDKYKILGLNVNVEDVDKTNIVNTLTNLEFIVHSLCIEETNLNSKKIDFIYQFDLIEPLSGWEIVTEEII